MNNKKITKKDGKRKSKGTWQNCDKGTMKEIMAYAEGYMKFLDNSKTEREACKEIVKQAEEKGFKNLRNIEILKTGDKVYFVNKGKSVYLAVIGEDSLTDGANYVGAHIDAPRLDLKQNPLYEDSHVALLKTHYYGGIKKYQWTTVPLALHGVVAKTDGTVVDISIGEKDDEPIFIVTDLLPHLSAKQNSKKLSEGIPGENLNIVIGSVPLEAEGEDNPVKTNILKLLNDKYGIEEDDFRSAELEAVPANKARSLGLDMGMVAAYGQDDRSCAYAALKGIFDAKPGGKTQICIFADKEEVGSMGNTGMKSASFELFMMEMLEKTGIVNPYALQRSFSASKALSADVTAGFDPTYPEVMEKHNSSFLGRGISIKKYTGARGKSGASDANAEFVAYVRGIFDKAGVCHQSSEMGKVDEGGGGTIAYILANRGMEVLDCGVPLHSMHAPYESSSKYDLYMAYKAYKAFLEIR